MLIAVLGVYAGISVVALSALPVVQHGAVYTTQLGTTYQRTTRCSASSSAFGPARLAADGGDRPTSALLAATILFIATNAGLIGISRLSWSLSEHRQLPGIFARLHPRYRTPWFTIVLLLRRSPACC